MIKFTAFSPAKVEVPSNTGYRPLLALHDVDGGVWLLDPAEKTLTKVKLIVASLTVAS